MRPSAGGHPGGCRFPASRCARLPRLAIVALHDCLALFSIASLVVFALPDVAFAYVDPSVMTYAIQALAGVAIALSAVAGVAFRRTRKALMKVLGFDENARKEVERTCSRIEPDPNNIYRDAAYFAADDLPQAAPAHAKRAHRGGLSAKLSWPKRFACALAIGLFCSLTLLFVAPCEIVAGSAGDLAFGVGDIWPIMLACSLACSVAVALVVSLVRGRAYFVALAIAFSLGLCCYVQAMALNVGLPLADGRDVDWWGAHGPMIVLSALVWVALVAASAVLAWKAPRRALPALCALSAVLVLVQGVGVASLAIPGQGGAEAARERAYVTEDGLFEVSPTGNVIVFVLDCYDTVRLEEALADDPGMLDEMSGFTWYANHSGEMIPTAFAVPYLFTHEVPQVGQRIDDYLASRYVDSPFLEDLHATGWSVGLYTDTFGLAHLTDDQARSEIFDQADNIHSIGSFSVSPVETVKMLVKCALYRDAPWMAKPRFRFYTDEVNRRIVRSEEGAAPRDTVYMIDDARYYDRLREIGVSVASGSEGAFRFVHLNGAHVPFNYDQSMNYVGEGASTQVAQAIGSMGVVSEYLRQLKSLGLYEASTIIITSDHGDWRGSVEPPDYATEPILLVKRRGEADGALKTSLAPVSHADFHATVLDAMGADYGHYGQRYDDIAEDADRVREMYQITHSDDSHIKSLLLYTIYGDVRDFACWEYTGEEWPADYNNQIID